MTRRSRFLASLGTVVSHDVATPEHGLNRVLALNLAGSRLTSCAGRNLGSSQPRAEVRSLANRLSRTLDHVSNLACGFELLRR